MTAETKDNPSAAKGTPKETTDRRPRFEDGETKIYVCVETLKYNDTRSLVQIGAVSSKGDVNLHLCLTPGADLTKRASPQLLGLCHWRNVRSSGALTTAQFEKEDGTLVDTVPTSEGVTRFLRLLKDANPPITLVCYSVSELRELLWEVQNAGAQRDLDINTLVSTVVVYEIYMELRKRPFNPLRQLLGVTANVYSADKLATLLRQLFIDDRRSVADFCGYPLAEKLPKSRIATPPVFKDCTPRYQLLSSCKQGYKTSWFKDPQRDPLVKFPSKEDERSEHNPPNGVTVFRTGVFGFNQPVIVKLWNLQEGVTAIDYTAYLEKYEGSGLSSVYRHNSVDYGILILENKVEGGAACQIDANPVLKVKDVMKYIMDNSRIHFTNHMGPTRTLPSTTANLQVDILFHSAESNTGVSLMSEPFSVLVKLVPAEEKKTDREKLFSYDQVFMTTSLLKSKTYASTATVLNPIFCPLQDQTNLARLVIQPIQTVSMSPGDKIGDATLVNQQNFKQMLSTAYLHELDINKLIEDPRIEAEKENKRRRRQKDEGQDLDVERPDSRGNSRRHRRVDERRTQQRSRDEDRGSQRDRRERDRRSNGTDDHWNTRRAEERYDDGGGYFSQPYYQDDQMEPNFDPSNIPDNYLFSRR